MNLQTDQFNLCEIVKDELTNILVQSLWNSERRITNRSVQSLLLWEMILQTDHINLHER
jgi:hypothetical protein